MEKKISKGRRLRRTLAYGLAAAVLAVAAVALPMAGYRLRTDANEKLDDLERGERHPDAAFLAAVNAESGVRGYVITGDRAFLAPYENGYRIFVEQLGGAMRYTMDNDRLLGALDNVAQDMEGWLTVGARPEVAAVEQGRVSDAQEWVASGLGKTSFDSLRANTNAALIVFTEEQRTAQENLDEATLWMLVLGGLGLLCAFGVVAIVVHETTAYQMETERHQVTRGGAQGSAHREQTARRPPRRGQPRPAQPARRDSDGRRRAQGRRPRNR